ncbi:MAG: HNH endonuclease [Desulfobacterales bacterium]|nr:HNH endonuclease [Desulfobacterales bacterium]
MIYVISKNGKPLMPTKRHGKVRHLLNDGMAKVISTKPFTIQLLYETTEYTQAIILGIDAGYQNIGFSAVSENQEIIAGECKLIDGQVEKNKERAMYRRQRRQSLRYRKPKFDNRKKKEGWLAPSIQHKLDSHIRLIEKLKKTLPITQIIVEAAAFDIQLIKNPSIYGAEYQQGEQTNYWNLREYILHRDKHKCQNPDCRNTSKEKILEIHHIGFWKEYRSDRPANLITLCTKCHIPRNHQKNGFLYGWEPEVKSFRPETFMSIVRWRMINTLKCLHTYGHITKSKRIALKLSKSHVNDAFVIANGMGQKRIEPLNIKQVRRNNRSLEKFYDAKYIDIRSGNIAKGKDLDCGRRVRNICSEKNATNLKIFRGEKTYTGHRSIRKKRYSFQPSDIAVFDGIKYGVTGIQNHGSYIKLKGLSKPVKIDRVNIYRYGKGFNLLNAA